MTLSEALAEIKNNKIIRRANSNTSYCYDSKNRKFGSVIKYNKDEGVHYDMKFSELDRLSFDADDLFAEDWIVDLAQ
jgi:hypothetical protein